MPRSLSDWNAIAAKDFVGLALDVVKAPEKVKIEGFILGKVIPTEGVGGALLHGTIAWVVRGV